MSEQFKNSLKYLLKKKLIFNYNINVFIPKIKTKWKLQMAKIKLQYLFLKFFLCLAQMR